MTDDLIPYLTYELTQTPICLPQKHEWVIFPPQTGPNDPVEGSAYCKLCGVDWESLHSSRFNM